MRLIAVFNLPVILLALVVGAAAVPSGSPSGDKPSPKSGLSPFAPVTLFWFDSKIEGGQTIQIDGKPSA
jgi:hypothetical protein